jgi:hypothetical protein
MKRIPVLLLFFAVSAYADFSALDIDGDGRVSKAEAAGNAEIMAIFDRADRDRDGRLTQAEMDAYEKRLKAKAASASAGGTKAKARKKKPKDAPAPR